MGSFWNFAFATLLIVLWIIAGGFVTQANVKLGPYRNDDDQLSTAYWRTFWAAFITWTLVGLIIILIILVLIGVVTLFATGVGEVGAVAVGGTTAAVTTATTVATKAASTALKANASKGVIKTGISWVTILFLIVALILVSLTGILAATAASSIVSSPNYDPNNEKLSKAYTNCVIAAIMCLGTAGVLIIGFIVYLVIGIQNQRKAKVLEKQIAELEAQQAAQSQLQEAIPATGQSKTSKTDLALSVLQQAQDSELLKAISGQAATYISSL